MSHLHKVRQLRGPAVLALVAALVAIGSPPAHAISTGLYVLGNHPDGNAVPPPYGLRLDGLLTGDTNEIYTFNFEAPESSMILAYDGSEIRIYGSALGLMGVMRRKLAG